MSNMKKILLVFALVALCLGSEVKEQQSLAVTIYNNNFAMVKDVRLIEFS